MDRLKVNAASRSMHQFIPMVRSIFPPGVRDDAAETALVFLYVRTAEAVFNKRFSVILMKKLRGQLKYITPRNLKSRLKKTRELADRIERAAEVMAPSHSVSDEFQKYISSVIKAMLTLADFPRDDEEILRQAHSRFDDCARVIKSHLMGIKQQPHYILK